MNAEFDKVFKPLGGAITFKHDYREVINIIAKNTSEFYTELLTDSVFADILDSNNINAVVCKVRNQYFIGVTNGLIQEGYQLIGQLVDKTEVEGKLKTPIKNILWSQSVIFCIYHEIGHILNGHFKDIEEEKYYFEVNNQTEKNHKNTFNREIEADIVATVNLCAFMMTKIGSSGEEDLKFLIDTFGIAYTLGLLIASIGVLFMTLGNKNQCIDIKHAGNLYPHYILRVWIIFIVVDKFMELYVEEIIKKDYLWSYKEDGFNYVTKMLTNLSKSLNSFISKNRPTLKNTIVLLKKEFTPFINGWILKGIEVYSKQK